MSKIHVIELDDDQENIDDFDTFFHDYNPTNRVMTKTNQVDLAGDFFTIISVIIEMNKEGYDVQKIKSEVYNNYNFILNEQPLYITDFFETILSNQNTKNKLTRDGIKKELLHYIQILKKKYKGLNMGHFINKLKRLYKLYDYSV